MPMLSGYRIMWMVLMFDLPVTTKSQRKAAAKFRQWLLDEGWDGLPPEKWSSLR